MKFILRLLGLIGIIIIAGVGYLAYSLGIIGTPKPKNLGVAYSAADLATARDKSRVESSISGDITTGSEPIRYEGSHAVNQTFSSQELTALANEQNWSGLPFSHIQIRINPDNSVDFSGNVATAKLADYLVVVGGLSRETAEKVKGYAPVQGNPGFYLNTSGKIINNEFKISLNTVQVGPVSIPGSYISQYQPMVVEFLNSRLAAWPGMEVKSLSFSEGKLVFDGFVPDKEIIAQ